MYKNNRGYKEWTLDEKLFKKELINKCNIFDINNINDVNKLMPGVISGIREWFRWYKTPDNKPLNTFGYNEQCLDSDIAIKVIEETHSHYMHLRQGKSNIDNNSLWLPASQSI